MQLKFFKLLPFLLLVSCSNTANKGDETKDSVNHDSIVTNDSVPVSIDSTAMQDSIFDDGVVEEVIDTTAECFQMSHNDILNFKNVLGDSVLSSGYKSVRFKMENGLVGEITRYGGIYRAEWCDFNGYEASQNFTFIISGFDGSDWKNIDSVKNLFASQCQRFKWKWSKDVLNVLKCKFEFDDYHSRYDKLSDESLLTAGRGNITFGDDNAKFEYEWSELDRSTKELKELEEDDYETVLGQH